MWTDILIGCVIVFDFSPVTKASLADQQDFELLAQSRINSAALCVALSVFQVVQALKSVNYAELIFTQVFYTGEFNDCV